MGCSYAVNGYTCSVTGDRCMFAVPNSTACAEMYGEGPDAKHDTCETCTFFYTENGGRRCHRGLLDSNANDLHTTTNVIEDDLVCCGAHTEDDKELVVALFAELEETNQRINRYYEFGTNPYMMQEMIEKRDELKDEFDDLIHRLTHL